MGSEKHTESLPLPSETALFLIFPPNSLLSWQLALLHVSLLHHTHTKPNHKVKVGRGLPYEAGVSISPAWPWASSVPWQLWSHPEALTQSHRSSGTRRANAAGSEPHVAADLSASSLKPTESCRNSAARSHIFPPVMYPHTYTESEGFFFFLFLTPILPKKTTTAAS